MKHKSEVFNSNPKQNYAVVYDDWHVLSTTKYIIWEFTLVE